MAERYILLVYRSRCDETCLPVNSPYGKAGEGGALFVSGSRVDDTGFVLLSIHYIAARWILLVNTDYC